MQRPRPGHETEDRMQIFEVNAWFAGLDDPAQFKISKDPSLPRGEKYNRNPAILFQELRDSEAKRHELMALKLIFD